MSEIPQDGRYYIKGARIFKAPKATKVEGGKSITIGFPVCEVTEYIGAEGMAFIVEALNLHEAGHTGCMCPHCNPSEDTKVLDAALSKLRRDQAARVMPVAGAMLDFWEMMPNDEKDLVRTNPRLACLLDELEAAMEGDGPFTTDEVE